METVPKAVYFCYCPQISRLIIFNPCNAKPRNSMLKRTDIQLFTICYRKNPY